MGVLVSYKGLLRVHLYQFDTDKDPQARGRNILPLSLPATRKLIKFKFISAPQHEPLPHHYFSDSECNFYIITIAWKCAKIQ